MGFDFIAASQDSNFDPSQDKVLYLDKSLESILKSSIKKYKFLQYELNDKKLEVDGYQPLKSKDYLWLERKLDTNNESISQNDDKNSIKNQQNINNNINHQKIKLEQIRSKQKHSIYNNISQKQFEKWGIKQKQLETKENLQVRLDFFSLQSSQNFPLNQLTLKTETQDPDNIEQLIQLQKQQQQQNEENQKEKEKLIQEKQKEQPDIINQKRKQSLDQNLEQENKNEDLKYSPVKKVKEN
ncbi:hypothetical protein PPERSA_11058 [Pseudocohnilembus persalinus]|uniref:Uncharacterized protein n=1 Tax=Pseudocohnilembus persalinus TaxID=266149 RepID=A0A0V0R026_PSEPJ|nr:hypothetical protein PPERSA_11058 [Pseudocohnilembus persalinus]|eukprot:KRX07509.1 hypothetical protein PPERSA_11058 [Pseudocohnilembus persalinus]